MNFQKLKVGKNLAPWVTDLKGRSGVYLIRTTGFFGRMKYIGESHTGHLKKTLLRHFQRWKGPTAGPTFDPDAVEIGIVKTRPEKAVEFQNALIAELDPEINTVAKPGFWG